MAFAKRHYVRIAEKLKSVKPPLPGDGDPATHSHERSVRWQWRQCVVAVADGFQEFEPQRFNRHAFLDAAGWKEEDK